MPKAKKKVQEEVKEQTQVEQPEQQEAVNLSLSDISLSHRVIALAQKRGAFNAEEMSTVGALYDKLSVFLRQQMPETEKGEGETQEQTDTAE